MRPENQKKTSSQVLNNYFIASQTPLIEQNNKKSNQPDIAHPSL
jgi:hypothetical protein